MFSDEEVHLRSAKYNMQEFVESVKIGGKRRHIPRKVCVSKEWRPFSK